MSDGPAPTLTVPTEGCAVTLRPEALPPSVNPVRVVADVLYAMFCVPRLVVGVGELILTDTLLVLDDTVPPALVAT